MTKKRKPGRPKAGKTKLTKDAIIQAAYDFVNENGIESLSMRKLASMLGVDAMAVYYHLKNKNAVLTAIVEKAIDFSRFNHTGLNDGSTEDWKYAIKEFARYYLCLFRSHRDLMIYLITNPSSAPKSISAANEILFAILQTSGLTSSGIIQATDIIVDYLNGYGLAESTGRIPDNDERITQFKEWVTSPESSEYPVTRHVVSSTKGNIATDFELGLDCILAGIKVLQRSIGSV